MFMRMLMQRMKVLAELVALDFAIGKTVFEIYFSIECRIVFYLNTIFYCLKESSTLGELNRMKVGAQPFPRKSNKKEKYIILK